MPALAYSDEVVRTRAFSPAWEVSRGLREWQKFLGLCRFLWLNRLGSVFESFF
jgi:hypothetical protein